MNNITKYIIFSVLTAIVLIPWSLNVAYAYETAPRISDREIIESLVELKQGQKNMNQRFEDMNQRFEDMNQRFENMNQSFNQRFESMQNLMLALFGSAMAFVLGMLGYIIWDRKTAQQPFKRRLYNLENEFVELEEQLEMKNPSGPVTARLVASFKQLAETDEKVAAILKTYSLL
jgi:predicted PurR-regulated permease PerM